MDDKPKVAVNWDYVPSDAITYLIDQYIHNKRNRAILKAHFIDGDSYETIAEAMKCSARTVGYVVESGAAHIAQFIIVA